MLHELGVHVAGAALFEKLKSKFASKSATREAVVDAVREVAPQLTLDGLRVAADKAIEILAREGHIEICGTTLYAKDSLFMGSAAGATFKMGNDSTSQTSTTKIEARGIASMEGRGATAVRQNPDGTITLHTGGEGVIEFKT